MRLVSNIPIITTISLASLQPGKPLQWLKQPIRFGYDKDDLDAELANACHFYIVIIFCSSAICTHAHVVNSAALPLSLNPSNQAVFSIIMFVHAYTQHIIN